MTFCDMVPGVAGREIACGPTQDGLGVESFGRSNLLLPMTAECSGTGLDTTGTIVSCTSGWNLVVSIALGTSSGSRAIRSRSTAGGF